MKQMFYNSPLLRQMYSGGITGDISGIVFEMPQITYSMGRQATVGEATLLAKNTGFILIFSSLILLDS